jgi:hypothetical protein
MWAEGGHSDEANNNWCQFGRAGDTQNCVAPEIYKPIKDGNPDVCCYTREAVNEYFYRPSEIVASWKSMGSLDPTHQSCKTVGTEIAKSRTENYEKQVKTSLSAGVGVSVKTANEPPLGASFSVQETMSTSSTWSVTQSVSDTDCDATDVTKHWVENGWIWKWQWSALVTTMWGDQFETVFADPAYTPNEAHPPKCVPGYYAPGHYPDYQECDDSGARMSSGNQSMEAIIV